MIAAVTVGVYMGWHTPELTTPTTRIQGISVWEILTFLLNAVLFLLWACSCPGVLDDLDGRLGRRADRVGAAGERRGDRVRLAWGFTVPYVLRAIDRRESVRAPACIARASGS